jgi:uncharacterized membrane protein
MDLSLYTMLRFLHICSAILFVGGIFARQAVRTLIARAKNPAEVKTINLAAGKIERFMVIPGNLLVVVFGVPLALSINAPMLGVISSANQNWLLASIVILVLLAPLVPLVFLPRGRVFEVALNKAISEGIITPELEEHIGDPLVRSAHLVEMIGVTIVVVLMILRPF